MAKESASYIYAEALSSIAGINLEKTEAELLLFNNLLKSNRDLELFFESPKVPAIVKKEKIKKGVVNKFSNEVLNLLYILIDKRRTKEFSAIVEAFVKINDSKFNRVRPKIVIGKELSKDGLADIEKEIESLLVSKGKKFGAVINKETTFIPETLVNSDLLGGFTLRVGDYQWDASVSNYIKTWKKNVLSAQIDEKTAHSID